MNAYFEKGIDLSENENLVHIATSLGLDGSEVESFLKSNELTIEVKLEEQRNHQRGISGVPFYIINDKYGVSGAQPMEGFIQAFNEIGSEASLNGEASDV